MGASSSGDLSSPLANPAAMVEADYFRLFLASYHAPDAWTGGQYLGLAAPIRPLRTEQALSAGVYGDWDWDYGPGSGPGFRGWERTYQLGYAFRMPPWLPFSHQLAFGANGYWHQFGHPPEAGGQDFGLDAGLHWNPMYSSRWGEAYLDAAILNLLSPYRRDSVSGKSSQAMPPAFNGGMLWRSPLRDVDLHAGVLIRNLVGERAAERAYHPGGGVTWHPRRDWELELRYNLQGFPEAGGAYRVFRGGSLQILEGRCRLGWDRIQLGMAASLFTRKDLRVQPHPRYRRIRMYPDDPYPLVKGEARRFTAARRHYLAAYTYGRLIARFPSHLHADSNAFEYALCLDRLGFHALARETFRDNLDRYPDGNHTRLIADNMRELMRLDYLTGEYDAALARDSLFQVRFPESPFAPTFAYFKAQIYFSRGRFAEAIPLYASVPADNAYHASARHNLALCQLKTGAVREAIGTFTALMDMPGRDSADTEIRESARVKTGMILSRLEDPRADSLLAGVGTAGAYADEALLARAWLAARRGDFPRAESLAGTLMVDHPRSALAMEACVLKALAVYRQGRGAEALSLADSVLGGYGRDVLLPEEADTVEQAAAESGTYDSLQRAFHREAAGERDARTIGCRRPAQFDLESLRQRHFLAAACRKREAKAKRYAQAREEAVAVAGRLRGILESGVETRPGR